MTAPTSPTTDPAVAAVMAMPSLVVQNGPSSVAPEKIAESWLPVDLAAVFARGLKPPETRVLYREDNVHLFYPGKLHSVIGESGCLKTWVTLLAAYQEIRKGNRVLFVDFEDHEESMMMRMEPFGLTRTELIEQFTYAKPQEPLNEKTKEQIKTIIEGAAVDGKPYTLVVIDGVTEIMSMHEWKVNDQEGVAEFYRHVAKWFCSLGPATVIIDHVTKSKESRGKDAIGAQHKRAGIDGASYRVELKDPFGRGRHGRSYMYIAKDKNGAIQPHAGETDFVGTFNIISDATTGELKAWISLPNATAIAPATAGVPNVVPQQVLRSIMAKAEEQESKGQLKSKTFLANNVQGHRKDVVLKGIDVLVGDGYIGPGGSGKGLRVLKKLPKAPEGLEDFCEK
jgi:hypothetical protein